MSSPATASRPTSTPTSSSKPRDPSVLLLQRPRSTRNHRAFRVVAVLSLWVAVQAAIKNRPVPQPGGLFRKEASCDAASVPLPGRAEEST
jgi:hypothetical protein